MYEQSKFPILTFTDMRICPLNISCSIVKKTREQFQNPIVNHAIRGTIDTPKHIHERSHSCLGIRNSMKSCGVKVVKIYFFTLHRYMSIRTTYTSEHFKDPIFLTVHYRQSVPTLGCAGTNCFM